MDGVLKPSGLVADRARTLESAEAIIAGAMGDESPYDVVFWDKRVFGDDPTCSITRDDNPDCEPYHVLLAPMAQRGSLPELVVACFDRVLTLPLRTPVVVETLTAAAVAERPSPNPNLKSDTDPDAEARRSLAGRVLLVEDNEVNRTVARRQLEGMDLDVVEAQDGLQALAALDRETFDMILMDCEMPNLDGYHTTEEIRMGEDGADYRIPIIAMTALTSDADRQRCMDAGMDAFIAKPVKAETMYLVLRQFLRPGIHRQHQHRSSGPA